MNQLKIIRMLMLSLLLWTSMKTHAQSTAELDTILPGAWAMNVPGTFALLTEEARKVYRIMPEADLDEIREALNGQRFIFYAHHRFDAEVDHGQQVFSGAWAFQPSPKWLALDYDQGFSLSVAVSDVSADTLVLKIAEEASGALFSYLSLRRVNEE